MYPSLYIIGGEGYICVDPVLFMRSSKRPLISFHLLSSGLFHACIVSTWTMISYSLSFSRTFWDSSRRSWSALSLLESSSRAARSSHNSLLRSCRLRTERKLLALRMSQESGASDFALRRASNNSNSWHKKKKKEWKKKEKARKKAIMFNNHS